MINDRIAQIGDYPFRRLAQLLGSVQPPADLAPILMSVGEPQLAAPALIAETLAANAHLWGKYPPTPGTPDWRLAVADWLNRRYRLPAGLLDPDRHIVPAPGTRESLFMIALAAVPTRKAGQRPAVCMPDPFYQVYVGASVLGDAEPVFLPAMEAGGFLPDLDALTPALLDRTAIIYLCNPTNPQGAFAPLDYLKRLIELARAHDAIVAFDECYAEIYGDVPPAGGLEACAALGGGFDNVVVFHSLSKRSSAPGLRSGFVAGDAKLIQALLRVMEYGSAGMPLPVQIASAALWRDEAHVQAVRAVYAENFRIAERVLGNRFGFRRPPGGFYLWLDVGDSEAAARRLWQEGAIRTLPGAYLSRAKGADGRPVAASRLRVALVHAPEVTETALGRLSSVLAA
jgi:N-succinyldiaminopimelate aminotransferase